MREHPRNPTLLVGLGAFGRDVLEFAQRGSEPRPQNLACVRISLLNTASGESPAASSGHLSAKAEPPDTGARASETRLDAEVSAGAGQLEEAVLAQAERLLRNLLDLSHFVDHTEPGDPRGPRCDVLLIADLSETELAPMAASLAGALAQRLRSRFHTILRAGDGALSVCPLLCVPREAERAAVASVLRSLAALCDSTDAERRLGGRVFVVEDQSGKYLLSRAELVHSFAAFLYLLLYAGLRDHEAGTRKLLERPPEERSGPFGTFACATLELNPQDLAALCALKLAREMLQVMRQGRDPTIAEIAALATPLVVPRGRLETLLWQEGNAGSLEKHLEPPVIDVPTIEWDDSPEDIVERKFNAIWHARTEARIRAFREDVERLKMDRLAGEIERCGKTTQSALLADLEKHIAEELNTSPRGHARALEMLRDAATRARALREEVEAEIESPDLLPFPESPLNGALLAVIEAAFHRPRRLRMQVFRALLGGVSSILISGILLGIFRVAGAAPGTFFQPGAPLSPPLLHYLSRFPVPLLLGAAGGFSSVSYRLWKHFKRHHNWALEARDSLDQALKAYVCRDIVSYFYKRLHYTRLLWVQRIYRALCEQMDEAIALLEGVRKALAHADLWFGKEERKLRDKLEESNVRGGILFRGLLSPAGAHEIYAELRPADVNAVTERFCKQALEQGEWREAHFADPEKIRAFASKEMGRIHSLCPFRPDSGALFSYASAETKHFVQRLALKLSPPLFLRETESSALESRPRHCVYVPPEAEPLVQELLAQENLRGSWEIHGMSDDSHRISLFIERTGIRLEAFQFDAMAKIDQPRSKSA